MNVKLKKDKKKMDELTKIKLIYSGELIIIALVFLVVAILELSKVIIISYNHHIIFNWVTIFGGLWLIIDFIWASISNKRRQRICYLDKIINLPLGPTLIAFDIISFVNGCNMPDLYYQIGQPCFLIYICIDYIFQGLYHFKYPLPEIIEEYEKAKAEEIEQSKNDIIEENNNDKNE